MKGQKYQIMEVLIFLSGYHHIKLHSIFIKCKISIIQALYSNKRRIHSKCEKNYVHGGFMLLIENNDQQINVLHILPFYN